MNGEPSHQEHHDSGSIVHYILDDVSSVSDEDDYNYLLVDNEEDYKENDVNDLLGVETFER